MQLILALATVLLSAAVVRGSPPSYIEYEPSFDDVYGTGAEQAIYGPQLKRSACIAKGGNCDHSPSDCCPGTSCRCNLWGANCKCQRKGLFANRLG